MKQVEIFQTDVCKTAQAEMIIQLLREKFPHYQCNFDLDDCDHILRIEAPANRINKTEIEKLVAMQGHVCSYLP